MGPFGVIVVDPPSQAGTCLATGLEGIHVNALILQRPPQSLNENIVHPAAATIHLNLNTGRDQHLGEPQTGELAALIRIEDLMAQTPQMPCHLTAAIPGRLQELLLIGGAIKATYDVLLLVKFQKIQPPEEVKLAE